MRTQNIVNYETLKNRTVIVYAFSPFLLLAMATVLLCGNEGISRGGCLDREMSSPRISTGK